MKISKIQLWRRGQKEIKKFIIMTEKWGKTLAPK
jgi:hypothetical protein